MKSFIEVPLATAASLRARWAFESEARPPYVFWPINGLDMRFPTCRRAGRTGPPGSNP